MTTDQPERVVVIAVFDLPEEARDAVNELNRAGFRGDQVSLLAPDRDGKATSDVRPGGTGSDLGRTRAAESRDDPAKGVATGALAGGLLGALGGWLVGLGALAIPGVGPFIAAGALGTTLAGAALGAGVGAIAGALVEMGVSKEEAEDYEQEVRSGRSLVAVKAPGRQQEAERILRSKGGRDARRRDRGTSTVRAA